MQSQEIERYFQDLGDELELHGIEQPIRVMVVGGVFMLLMVKNRKATEDVDVVLLDFPDMTKLTPVTSAFKAAVTAVASRHHLKRKWMNDDVAYFIMDMAPDPQPQLWRAFKKLQSSIASYRISAGRSTIFSIKRWMNCSNIGAIYKLSRRICGNMFSFSLFLCYNGVWEF